MKKTKPMKMADELKKLGENWAFVVMAGTLVLIGPGEAFKGRPAMAYEESDLNEAVSQGLLQKKKWLVQDHTGKSWTLEVHVSPRTAL